MQLAESLFGQSFLRKEYGTGGAGLLFLFFCFLPGVNGRYSWGKWGVLRFSRSLSVSVAVRVVGVWVSANALQLQHANANTKMEKKACGT